MVININYKNVTLFDIEFYITKDDAIKSGVAWYSEMHCLPIVRGITRFLQDKMKDAEFNSDKFIDDSEVILEIRGWLYEKHNNKSTTYDECQTRHYNEFMPEFNRIIDDYCQKYGFTKNID